MRSSNNNEAHFTRALKSVSLIYSVEYKTFDILEDEEVRQGLKTFSNWPTYPQVYVKGELIGGLDIIKELQAGGELVATLSPPAWKRINLKRRFLYKPKPSF